MDSNPADPDPIIITEGKKSAAQPHFFVLYHNVIIAQSRYDNV